VSKPAESQTNIGSQAASQTLGKTSTRMIWLAGWWPAIAWAGVVFGLSSIPGTSLPQLDAPHVDKVAHAIVYIVLGACCFRGVRRTSALTTGRAVIMATCLAALYGISDEFHQVFTPNRTPDWRDAVADAVGGLVGALAAVAFTTFLQRHRADTTKTEASNTARSRP
jgi:VanZ family protein